MEHEEITTGRSSWKDRRRNAHPIAVSSAELVRTGHLPGQPGLPLVIEPNTDGVALHEWVAANRDFISASLNTFGGILFRGFGVRTREEFDTVLNACGVPLLDYQESATPRTQVGGKVYTSTEFPSDQTIAPHNELSTSSVVPMKIWFFCAQAPEVGGQTPIVDVRRVFQRLDPAVRATFAEKGWMLVRNYGDGFGLPWQDSFHTTERADVARYCDEHAMTHEWKPGDKLQTRQIRPAITQHPVTGEPTWFNHIAFWHDSSLAPEVRRLLRDDYAPEELPYQTFYGDGSTIPDDVAAQLREAYAAEEVVFDWQLGDLLMLDNMLVAHARKPYKGARRILVAMGDAYRRPNLSPTAQLSSPV